MRFQHVKGRRMVAMNPYFPTVEGLMPSHMSLLTLQNGQHGLYLTTFTNVAVNKGQSCTKTRSLKYFAATFVSIFNLCQRCNYGTNLTKILKMLKKKKKPIQV